VSLAKTAEPIEMLIGECTLVGPRNHVLDGDASTRRAILGLSVLFKSIAAIYAAKG